MVNFLQNKFESYENPSYKVKVIDLKKVHNIRVEAALTVFKTVEGSNKFHAMLFTPF